jgi:hypothetical protein
LRGRESFDRLRSGVCFLGDAVRGLDGSERGASVDYEERLAGLAMNEGRRRLSIVHGDPALDSRDGDVSWC